MVDTIESTDLDPFDEAEMQRPLHMDRHIRDTAPLVRLTRYDLWATGRHDLARRILKDWQSFTSTGGTGLVNLLTTKNWRKPSIILDTDPPEHNRARAVLNAILSKKALADFTTRAEAIADEMADRAIAAGSFDAARLAQDYLLRVMPDAVGFATEGREHLIPYAAMNFNAMGPQNRLYREAEAAAGPAIDWVQWQCRRENLSPGFGLDIYAHADTGEITEDEAGMLVRTFLSASLDTTYFAIGNAIKALIDHPEQYALLHEDPGLAAATFEETLRFSPPSHIVGRTTAKPVEIEGIPIPASEKILAFIAAANRDPAHWTDPDRFDITRETRGHLGLGVGVHGCVGQVVARIEATALLAAIAKRAIRLRSGGEPVRKLSNWLRGFETLPVAAE